MRRTALWLLISLALISCKESDPPVGYWQARDTSIGPTRFKSLSIDFDKNGSYNMRLQGASVSGFWKRDGDTVTLSPVSSDGRTPTGEMLPGTESLEMDLTLTLSEDGTEMTLKKHMIKAAGTLTFTKG